MPEEAQHVHQVTSQLLCLRWKKFKSTIPLVVQLQNCSLVVAAVPDHQLSFLQQKTPICPASCPLKQLELNSRSLCFSTTNAPSNTDSTV